MKKISEHIPPQAIDLEKAVIGALLIEPDSFDEVSGILSQDSFYDSNHAEIYASIKSLNDQNLKVDLLSVANELKKNQKLEQIGGPYYLSELAGSVATASNIEYHSRIIQQLFVKRALIQASQEIQKQSFDESSDSWDVYEYANRQLEEVAEIFDRGAPSISFKDLVSQCLDEYKLRENLQQKGELKGIPTPVHKLTDVTGGWQQGDLVVIAGRPSMGKTAFVLSCLTKAALANQHVCFYSLEMSAVRLMDRILSGIAGIDANSFKAGKLTAKDWVLMEQAIAKALRFNVHINDTPNLTIEQIRSDARLRKKKHGCSLIIIDYLQLIDSKGPKGLSREQQVSEMSRKAKLLARELNVPVLLLSQLNRGVESRGDKRPNLSDLRESGAIEQDADMVLLLYRAEYYGIEKEDNISTTGRGEIILAKHRNGKTGTIFFGYNPELTKIFDWINPKDLPKDFTLDNGEPPY